MSANELTQSTDQLLVRHTVHVDLLILVLQTHEPSQVRVQQGLDQSVARERLLVRMGGLEALLAVRHLAGDAGLHGFLRRVLLAELTLHPVRGRRHGSAVGDDSLSASLVRRVRSTQGGFLVPVDDVLQGHVAFESL